MDTTPSRNWILVVIAWIVMLCSMSAPSWAIDVRVGMDFRLECRFNPVLIDKKPHFYWIRSNVKEKDNVAIGESPLNENYRITFKPAEGQYDLLVSGATYDRDNGKFECRLKERGTGIELHAQFFEVTVLVPPSPPQINPVNPVAVEGQPTELVCSSVGGSPDPVLRWYRKGESNPLEAVTKAGGSRNVATTSTLVLQPQKEDDGAEYRCVAWSRALDANDRKETTVTLTVNYAPRVRVSPTPLSAEKGTSTQISCQVDAKPAVNNVRWLRSGRFIATTFNHTLRSLTLDDDGIYTCTADNGLGRVGEAELQLDVLYAPVVTVESRKEVDIGSSIAIPCNISAKPSPTSVEWVKEGDAEFHATGEILRISRVVATDTGRYFCRAINMIGGSERVGNASFQLFVRHEPGTAKITPEEPIAIDEDSVTMSCSADPPGWPTPQYRWWKAGAEATILAVSPEFTIPVTRPNNEGTYYCQPSNELGTGVASSVNLRVFLPPRFNAQLPPVLQKKAGDTDFYVTCSAQGKPKPSIIWLKDGEEIQPNDNAYSFTTDESEARFSIFTVRSTLRFHGGDRPGLTQITADDRGNYTCAFENQARRIESTMALKVEHGPILLNHRPKMAFNVGSDGVLTCQAQAYPRPNFEWTFQDDTISSDSGLYDTNVTALANDVYRGVLRIKDVKESDYGDYVCKVWNVEGDTAAAIRLQATSAPEKPTNLRLVEAGYDSVTLEWDEGFHGGFENTIYTVQYRSNVDNRMYEDDCQFSNPCVIRNLEQLHSYAFQVRAENAKGQSPLSNTLTASTILDVSRIPDAKQATFEPKSKLMAFHVDSPLSLIAFVESRDAATGDWKLTQKFLVRSPVNHEVVDLVKDGTEEIRIKLCLEANTTLCGEPTVAVTGEINQEPTKALTDLPTKYMVAIIVACVIGSLLFILIAVFYCYRRRRAQKLKKLLEMEKAHGSNTRPTITTQQPPPPYYAGLENKGRDQSMDTSAMDEAAKNTLYATQNGYGYTVSNGHINNGGDWVNMAYTEHSYSNSNNGGSVNSQDSLWQVKANGDVVNQDRSYHYDPMTHGGYGGFEDYSHYPPGDDYLNQRNQRDYVSSNADPYAAVHKAGKRMEHLESPYHNVSGLPDPYMEAEPEENKGQHVSLSFDESLESGYSTPNSRNRRVIREIIV